MKKYCLISIICLTTATAFSQTKNPVITAAAKDPKSVELSAIADTMLINRKAIVEEKKKRPRREKSVHKECTRMKS